MNKGHERNTNLNEGKRVFSKEFRNGDDDGHIKSNRGRNSRTFRDGAGGIRRRA